MSHASPQFLYRNIGTMWPELKGTPCQITGVIIGVSQTNYSKLLAFLLLKECKNGYDITEVSSKRINYLKQVLVTGLEGCNI